MSRTDTNKLIKILADVINNQPNEEINITVVAGGQLITGQLISEDHYFELDENIALKNIYVDYIKNPRNETLKALENREVAEFPIELKECFIYLKNAVYLNANLRNTVDEDGISVQIRVSDISAFTYSGYAG